MAKLDKDDLAQWILGDLRELIATIASTSEAHRLKRKRMAGLRRVGHLGKKADYTKLQALAKEILNDWDAVVALVNKITSEIILDNLASEIDFEIALL
jgi:hypothetical protein